MTSKRQKIDLGLGIALNGTPFTVPRTDTTTPTTVWSTLQGAHSIGKGILGFFTMIEANDLRLVCTEMRDAVRDAVWDDKITNISGNLEQWRKCFPNARAANVCNRKDLVDADFRYLQRVPYINMIETRITGAALVNLRGVHTLLMDGCSLMTEEGFVNLRGIHTLSMRNCSRIMGAGFAHLKGVYELKMAGCQQITDADLAHLKGIQKLEMGFCSQITDGGLAHLKGIKVLDIGYCSRITDEGFSHLKGIKWLYMGGCKQASITDKAFSYLEGIHTLSMNECNQLQITVGMLRHLVGIHTLHMYGCSQPGFGFDAYKQLVGIKSLLLPVLLDKPTLKVFAASIGMDLPMPPLSWPSN